MYSPVARSKSRESESETEEDFQLALESIPSQRFGQKIRIFHAKLRPFPEDIKSSIVYRSWETGRWAIICDLKTRKYPCYFSNISTCPDVKCSDPVCEVDLLSLCRSLDDKHDDTKLTSEGCEMSLQKLLELNEKVIHRVISSLY